MNSENDKTLLALSQEMSLFRAEMDTVNKVAGKIAQKTKRTILVVLSLLTAAAIYLAWLVFSMAGFMSVMLGHLDDMYGQFGVMSTNMHIISETTAGMGENIRGMPVIVKNMEGMNNDVAGMIGSVDLFNRDLTGMQDNIMHIHGGTREMAQRFENLNRAMGRIGYNVNQMGRPFP